MSELSKIIRVNQISKNLKSINRQILHVHACKPLDKPKLNQLRELKQSIYLNFKNN